MTDERYSHSLRNLVRDVLLEILVDHPSSGLSEEEREEIVARACAQVEASPLPPMSEEEKEIFLSRVDGINRELTEARESLEDQFSGRLEAINQELASEKAALDTQYSRQLDMVNRELHWERRALRKRFNDRLKQINRELMVEKWKDSDPEKEA